MSSGTKNRTIGLILHSSWITQISACSKHRKQELGHFNGLYINYNLKGSLSIIYCYGRYYQLLNFLWLNDCVRFKHEWWIFVLE